jgi:WD40 repeat protein
VAFSPDCKCLAVGGEWGATLVERSSGRELRRLNYADLGPGFLGDRSYTDNASDLCFSPDGQRLLTATRPPALWDVATGQPRLRLTGHSGTVVRVVYRPDGRAVATASADNTVRLWDADSGMEQAVLRGHPGRVGSVAFHPDGWCLASGGVQYGEVKLWDLTRPLEQRHLAEVHSGALGFSGDGRRLISVDALGWLRQRDVETGQVLQFAAVDLTHRWLTPAHVAAVAADGRRAAAVSEDLHSVKVYDTVTARELAVLPSPDAGAIHIALSPDGRRAAASAIAGDDAHRVRAVLVWDVDTGKTLFECKPRRGPLTGLHGAVTLSPDGQRVAFDDYRPHDPEARDLPGGGPAEARIKVCDVGSGQELLELPAGEKTILDLDFSADGALLAAGTWDGKVLIWDRAGRRLHEHPLAGPCWQLAFSPDGRRLAGVDRELVRVWDVASGHDVLLLRGQPPRSGDGGHNPLLAWSPDGRRLAAMNYDGSVSVWDAAERDRDEDRRALYAAAGQRAPRWHLRQAELAAASHDVKGTLFHLHRIPEKATLDVHERCRRGRLHMLAADLDAAAADFAAGLAAPIMEMQVAGLEYARLLLLRGDRAGHARLCARLQAALTPQDHASLPFYAGYARALASGGDHPAEPLRLVKYGLALAQNSQHILLAQGLGHHRAGAGAEAVAWLTKAEAAASPTAWMCWPALALAHHGRGDRAEAQRWLGKAEKWLAQAPGKADGTNGLLLGAAWLDFQILYREAQTLLGAKQP